MLGAPRAAMFGASDSDVAPPSAITLNSSAELDQSSAGTNQDITLNLDSTASGVNRRVFVWAVGQAAGLNFTSATFDQGGANSAAMALSNEIIAVPTPVNGALYSYAIPDGVPGGNKVLRIVADTSVGSILMARCYNNVGTVVAAGEDVDTATNDTSVVLNTGADGLLVTCLGLDQNILDSTPVSGNVTTQLDLGTNNSNGIAAYFGDWMDTDGATEDAGWASPSGGTVDLVVCATTYNIA